MTSIFTKIILGEIPSYRIYEDDQLYAFLTIEPHRLGHTLVVPKTEIGDVLEIPNNLYLHIMETAKNTIAPALKKATQAVRIGFLIEGFGVTDHAHLHLIPIFESGDMDASKAHKESHEDMLMISEKIRSHIL